MYARVGFLELMDALNGKGRKVLAACEFGVQTIWCSDGVRGFFCGTEWCNRMGQLVQLVGYIVSLSGCTVSLSGCLGQHPFLLSLLELASLHFV